MKNRKTCITRLLVVFSLLAILLSAVLIPLSASKAGTDPVLSGSEYGVTYNDGVYTVSINAERLAELLSSKSFDKETLISIMPEKVYDLLVKRDSASAIALLNDLIDITEYDQLKEDLPLDYFANLLSADELIELIYIDKLIETIDIKAVISSLDADEIEGIFKEGELEKLFESLDLTPIITPEKIELLLDTLTSEEINNALKEGAITRLITNGAVDLHKIIDSETIKKLFDENGIITDEEIQGLMSDPDIIEKMIADEEIVNELLHHPDFLADIAKHPEVIEDLVTDEVIIEIFLDDGILDDFVNNLSASTIKEIVLNDKYSIDLSDIITANVIKELDSDVLKSLISDEDINALADMLEDSELEEILNNNSDLINLDNIDIDDIYPKYIDEQKIMDSGVISDADLEALANLLDAEGKLDDIIEKNMSAIDLSGVEIGDIYPHYVDAQKIMDAGVISTADIETLANILDASGKLELIVNDPKNSGCIDLSGVEIDDVYGTYITIDTLTSTGVLSDSEIQTIKDSLSTDDIIDIMDAKGYADPDEITAKDLIDLGYVTPQSLVDAGYIDLDADLDTLLGDKKAQIAIELDCIVFDNIDFTTIFPDYISADTLINEGIINLSDDIDAILGGQKVSVAIELDCIDFSKIDFTTIFPDYISASTLIDEGIIDLATDLDLLFTKDEKIDLAIELDCIDFDKIDVASVYPTYITADELMSLISDEDLEKLDPSVFTSAGLTPSKVLDKVPNKSALIIDLYHDDIIDLSQIDFESMADKLSPDDRTHIVEEIKAQPMIKQHIIDMIQADIKELAHTIPVKTCYEKNIITDDMILDIISSDDINTILEKEIVKKETIFDAITDMDALIDEVDIAKLPMDKLLSVFDMGELVTEITNQNLTGFIKALNFQNIIKIEAFQKELKGLTVSEVKAIINVEMAKKMLVSKSSEFILTDLWAVTLNDNLVFHHDIGFDVAGIEHAMLDAIPTFDKIAELDESGVAASFVLKYMIEDTLYTNGFQIVFTGDTTALKNYAAKIVELVSFKVNPDNSIYQGFAFPAKLSELYVSAVDGTKLPEALRVKLAEIANYEFNKSDIGALNDAIIQKLTIEEITALLNAVNVSSISDKALEQLNIHRSQAQIVLDRSVSVLNKIFAFIESNPDLNVTLSSFYDKTLADFYTENGNFTFEFDTQFDTMAAVEKIKTLPEDIKMFFTNTTLSHHVTLSVTFKGLYEAEFVDNGDPYYVAYRTAGTPLTNITRSSALAGLGADGWDAQLADGSVVLDIAEMPEGDVKIAEKHTATFIAYNSEGHPVKEYKVLFSEFSHTLEQINSEDFAPTADAIDHYVFIWDIYNVTEYADFEAAGYYLPKTYIVTFVADGEVVEEHFYNIENTEISAPDVPAKDHYNGEWEAYTLDGGDKTVNAIYTAKTYTVTFMAEGTVIDIVNYTIEDTAITAPTVPDKAHYDGEWETYTLDGGNKTVNAVYTAKTYTVTFMADGNVVGTDTYTIEDTSITAPTVPDKAHYDGEWETYTLDGGDKTVNAVYTAKTYTVTFMADGNVVGTDTYTIEDTSITAPTVPDKAHYDGVWETYTLDGGDKTVNAVYTAKTYTVTFMADGILVGTATYTIENTAITAPTVPSKAGYTGVWETYTLDGGDKTVNAIYTEIPPVTTFTVTFVANGNVVGTVEYTLGDTSVAAPAVPAKAHYTGVWETYDLTSGGNITVNAKYSPITYSIIFKADGIQLAKLYYNIENSVIVPPTVPTKAGYTGYWPSYTLQYTDSQVVNAVYVKQDTPVETYFITFVDEDGTVYAKVSFTSETPVDALKAPETLPEKEGYKVSWPEFKHHVFDETIFEATGTYSFTVTAQYEAIKYYVSFVADGKEIAKVEYTVEDKDITAPAVPEKAGFTGVWEEYDLTELGDKTVNAVYTAKTYTVTFKADGKVVGTVEYTFGDTSVTAPAVPEKAGFTGVWEEYDLTAGGNITVNAIYTEIVTPDEDVYYITFVDENGNVIEKIEFTKSTDASTIKAPATVPEKAGYNVFWPSFNLFDEARFEETGTYSFTVTAVYEAINYTVTFMADGKVVATVTFTVETESIEEPAIPAKDGYSAAWSSYVLGTEDITVDAIYSTISYKVTFVADGAEVAVLYYTVEDKDITAPAVPAKEGFTGEWEKYTLDGGDKTVNAVYTPVEAEGGSSIFWWIMLAVLVVTAIVLVVIFFGKSKKKN